MKDDYKEEQAEKDPIKVVLAEYYSEKAFGGFEGFLCGRSKRALTDCYGELADESTVQIVQINLTPS